MTENQALLVDLFDKAALLRNKIESYNERSTASIRECVDKAMDLWIDYRPKHVDRNVRAVDSGWNYRLYTFDE